MPDDLGYRPASLPPWLAPVTLAARAPAVLTATRSGVGPAVAAQLYADKVVDAGLRAAPDGLRETLAAAMAAIEGARSYEEVEARLIELAPDAPERAADFAALIEGAVMLGIGAGAWATGEEADAS
ncbi:hypothetical protein [Sorangium sp. So ce388]|uniref:hypothetical protein n=1 Tax=Sorangium sp. So ce388 TaxID=3133309 RepID=UPI003F5B075C